MDNQSANTQPSIMGMDKTDKSSSASTILWITCIIAVILTVFLLMASRSAANAVTEKTQQKLDIDAVLSSSDYTTIEADVNSFQEAFTILSDLKANKQPKSTVLTELYKYITNDVTISNLALSSDGMLSMDGAAASYRAVADFMTGLGSYQKISDVKLAAASLNTADDVADAQKIDFSITAALDMSKDKTTDSSYSGSSSSDDSVISTFDTSDF